jgi:CRISPR-associated endonuclease/helicase Cas3
LIEPVCDPELLLHLVGSHHGRCRPFAPAIDDPSPVHVRVEWMGRVVSAPSNTQLETVGSGVAERFWRVVRRYGWWGEVWLESLVRLSDQYASRLERYDQAIEAAIV